MAETLFRRVSYLQLGSLLKEIPNASYVDSYVYKKLPEECF